MRAAIFALTAALLTGAFLVLCLPLGERGFVAWFALVPLLLAVRGRGFLVAFGASLIAIFFAAWLSSNGAVYTVRGDVKEDAWLFTGFGIFGFSFSIAFGVWGEPSTKGLKPWWFAALATLLESVLLLELPAHLALSQYRNAPMVQLASLGGIWLISFLVWWSNFALASWLASPEPWSKKGKGVAAIVSAIVLITLFRNAWLPLGGPKSTLAALQVAECDQDSMTAAQRKAAAAGAELAVWPEFGGLAMARSGETSILRKMPGPRFVTSFPDDAEPLPHNVAALFSNGHESPRYSKRKLFGGEKKMHIPGDRAVAADRIGLNVCFDSCFPFVIRDTARLGVSVVALPTIDPPSTHGFIAAMHASYTPFRASENGVAVVRADGYAYSMIVDPHGRIMAEAPPGDRILTAQSAVGPRWTLSKTLGDWWLWICGIALLWPRIHRIQAGSKDLAAPLDTSTA